MEKSLERENHPPQRKVGQKYKYIYLSLVFYRVLRCFREFIFVRDKNHFDRDKKEIGLFCPADKNPPIGR
jgi:hypothetical protein